MRSDDMAQEIENTVYTNDNGVLTINLLDDLEDAFSWASVTGTDNDKTFNISNRLALRFTGFVDMVSSSSSTEYAYIYAVVGENEVEIYHVSGFNFTAGRRYKITLGTSGDIALQLGYTGYDGIIADGIGLQFAIVNVQNTIDDSVTGFGIYIPRTPGSTSSGASGVSGITFMDATPKYLLTDDTEEILSNSSLQYIGTQPRARIAALVPLCGVASECVGTSAFGLMMGYQNVLQGRVQVEGVMYWCIGGLYMLEATEE
jgi:hypothetical protein